MAWYNLTHHPARLAVALAGIGFASVLMFMQMGFRNALFDSTVQILTRLNADLILVSKAHNGLVSFERFDRKRVYQARACPGVSGVYPVYVQLHGVMWKVADTVIHPVRLLACDPADPVFAIPEVQAHAAQLAQPSTALFDLRSKPRYGVPRWREGLGEGVRAELCDRSVRLVGAFELGTDFSTDGNLILSARNFAHYCPHRAPGQHPLDAVDLAVVQLEPGADPATVHQQLVQALPDDVRVYTKQGFIDREIAFWARSTPIGYIFTLGMMIAFLVGVIVCYQIINADISDHIPELATLKAIGYRPGYFIGFVLQEGLYLSMLSFVPALVVSLGLYALVARATGLLMFLTVRRALLILMLTMGMCLVSGCLAVRKVLAADPADLY